MLLCKLPSLSLPFFFQAMEDHVAFLITVPTTLAIFLSIFILVCIESVFKKLLRLFSLLIWGCLVAMGYLFMFSGGIVCPWDQVRVKRRCDVSFSLYLSLHASQSQTTSKKSRFIRFLSVGDSFFPPSHSVPYCERTSVTEVLEDYTSHGCTDCITVIIKMKITPSLFCSRSCSQPLWTPPPIPNPTPPSPRLPPPSTLGTLSVPCFLFILQLLI